MNLNMVCVMCDKKWLVAKDDYDSPAFSIWDRETIHTTCFLNGQITSQTFNVRCPLCNMHRSFFIGV